MKIKAEHENCDVITEFTRALRFGISTNLKILDNAWVFLPAFF